MELEIIGEGKTTKVYRDGHKAIKLYINAPLDEAYNEAKKQRFAADAGLPVPKVYDVVQRADGVALEMEYIAGHALIMPKMDKLQRHTAIKALAELQCAIHGISGEGLPTQTDTLAWRIGDAPNLDGAMVDRLLDALMKMDSGKTSLCHGDFHPLNILNDGERLWIIDWVDAACGNPLADACRTYLIFKQYMSRMSGIYLRAFCEAAGVKQEDVLAWLPLVAAGRLRENLNEKERAFLMGVVEEGMR